MTQAARTTAAAAAAARLESVQTLHNPPALLGNLPEKGEECDHGVFPLRATIIRCITFTHLGLCWLLPVATTWMLEPCERDKPPLFVVKRFLIGKKRELFDFTTRLFL